MSLPVGTRLGPYEVLSPLGAGGMGEVYRASDTRLGRDVAIKILPSHLRDNPELRQRFEREARAISSLNHPNICTLHDIGQQDGVDFLVMEHLEGESLAKRLGRGPLPTSELLKYGGQIADALEKAHRAGIVHRDLKPGNIVLTKTGAKLLDFGLAKPLAAVGAAGLVTATQNTPASDPITEQGRIAGTVHYMSPEQVEGAELDARSDIFSLGSVLYEMATGKRAFEGKSSFSVASAILERDPEPISAVQPFSPPALENIVRTCLAKDREERWQSAADVARQLQWISQAGSQATITPLPARVHRRIERIAWAAAVVALLALVALLIVHLRQPEPSLHAEIVAPPGATFDFMGDVAAPPVLSPDGSMIVFGAHTEKEQQALWVRNLRTGVMERLAGTEAAVFPFWSPDSKTIAFFAQGKMLKTPATGGGVTTITETGSAPRGGCWGPDNLILYTPDYLTPLYRVNASGGPPAEVTSLGTLHTTHRWPVCLPDGKHFLYYATNHANSGGEKNGIYFASLDGKVNKLVLPSDAAALYANGYLLYHQQNELVAQRFDLSNGTLSGDPHVLTDAIAYDPGTWRLLMTASENGELLYQRGQSVGGTQLEWADSNGKALSQLGTPAGHNGFSISPDGKKVAVAEIGRFSNIFILDAQTGMKTRLTFDPAGHFFPSWSPGGSRILYSDDDGTSAGRLKGAIHVKAANGTGNDEVIYRPDTGSALWAEWSRDGRYIAFLHETGPRGTTLEAIPAGGGKPFVIVKPQVQQASITEFDISPDSHWVAYTSTDSGTQQVYVSTFPSGNGRWQVSTDGAANPIWSPKSDELFFMGDDFTMYAARYKTQGGDFQIMGVQQEFAMHTTAPAGRKFDIAPSGKFLLDVASQQSSAPLRLVVNWPSELKK